MKVGLYFPNGHTLSNNLGKVNGKVDLLVFPEAYDEYKGKSHLKSDQQLIDDTRYVVDGYIRLVDTAVILGFFDGHNYFSVYANGQERLVYRKHFLTGYSPLVTKKPIEKQFAIANNSNMKVGMSCCYDIYSHLIALYYKKRNVDLLVNHSYADVNYKKWHSLHKTRAIEMNSFVVCTLMKQRKQDDLFAYDREGKTIVLRELNSGKDINEYTNKCGKVYFFDTDDYQTRKEEAVTKTRVPYGETIFNDPDMLPSGWECHSMSLDDFINMPTEFFKKLAWKDAKPLFDIQIDQETWDKKSSLIRDVANARVLEFSPLCIFREGHKVFFMIHQATGYKTSSEFYNFSYPFTMKARWIRGFKNTTSIMMYAEVAPSEKDIKLFVDQIMDL